MEQTHCATSRSFIQNLGYIHYPHYFIENILHYQENRLYSVRCLAKTIDTC